MRKIGSFLLCAALLLSLAACGVTVAPQDNGGGAENSTPADNVLTLTDNSGEDDLVPEDPAAPAGSSKDVPKEEDKEDEAAPQEGGEDAGQTPDEGGTDQAPSEPAEKPDTESDTTPDAGTVTEPDTEPDTTPDTTSEPEPDTKPEPDTTPDTTSDPETDTTPDTPPDPEPGPAPETTPAQNPEPDPEPQTTSAKATAEGLIDQPVSALYAAIGKPLSSDYASSCLGTGEDGNLYYDGFTVYTYREGASEVITYVE